MGLLFCAIAFVAALVMGRKSLGRGLGVLLTVGYFYGLLRARFLDGFSHFMFDAALAGLYLAQFTARTRPELAFRVARVRSWWVLLSLWPVFTILLAPLLDSQHVLIQFVGLRAAILFLPLLLLGARLEKHDLEVLTGWLVALNAIAFVFAVLEMQFGIEPFFPLNEASNIIYISDDIGIDRWHRIPSTFGSAHAFAGTMLASLPFLLYRLQQRRSVKSLTGLVMATSVIGIFASGARSPVVQLALVLILLALTTRLNIRTVLGIIVVGAVVFYFVKDNPRFQRFQTLEDTEYVQTRVGQSANMTLLEVIAEYPLGIGLGSAAGTSIPYFLADLAKPQRGLENEFGRIALEQGLIGLFIWLAFLIWSFVRWPHQPGDFGVITLRMMWILTGVIWATAFIGTGLLTSIPFSTLVLLQMGMVTGQGGGERFVRRPVYRIPRPELSPSPAPALLAPPKVAAAVRSSPP